MYSGLVKVDDLRPAEFRKKAFKRLVIRDDHKKIIKAMVQASNLDKPGFKDLVSGKGRGLTILLHGPPGTGKTLTAGKTPFQNIEVSDELTFRRMRCREERMPPLHNQLWRPRHETSGARDKAQGSVPVRRHVEGDPIVGRSGHFPPRKGRS